jgi:hypothetical protein
MRVATVALAFLSTSAAVADTLPPLPHIAKAAVKEMMQDCHKTDFEKGFVFQKDVNGDGIADIILDYEHATCDGQSNHCGSGGCSVEIFASLKRGRYSYAYGGLVQGYEFTKAAGLPAIKLDLHGSFCGKAGVEPCPSTLVWDGKEFTPAH